MIGAWAARAPLGSPAVMMGPKGSVVLDGTPGEVVIAGDDSAVPAVRRYLGVLGSRITGHLLLETRFDLGRRCRRPQTLLSASSSRAASSRSSHRCALCSPRGASMSSAPS